MGTGNATPMPSLFPLVFPRRIWPGLGERIETRRSHQQHFETMKNFFFVYQKGDDFKALDYHDATAQEAGLKADGWKHIATLGAREFIEWYYKNNPTE
jgi:hypothetical protein